MEPPTRFAKPSVQPIAFPHVVQVQQYKIDCQYCHADARRSEYAGLPSVERCMGCHKITAADKPEIKKLAEYAAKREPIPWARVYKLPEFTYFPHKAHIRAEVACQTCHGPVETMTTAAATTGPTLTNDLLNLVGLRPAPPPLTMGLVRGLPSPAERHARHPGAARLRDVPPLRIGART